MPIKIGAGGKPQPYEQRNGEYSGSRMTKGSLYDGAGSEGGEDFKSKLQSVLDGTYDKESGAIEIGDTPNVYCEYADLPKLPLIINYDAAYLAMNKSGYLKGNYHDLGIDIMAQLPKALEDPEYIFRSDNPKRVEVLTSLKDKKGQPIFAVLEKNDEKSVNYKKKFANIIVTAFGPRDKNYTNKRIGKIIYKKKN